MSHALALPRVSTALTTASLTLPDDTDALSLLTAVPSVERFFWEQRDAGIAIAGVGEAWSIRASGDDRFRRVADAVATLPQGALAMGGFAFAAETPRTAPWREFPSTQWIVPRLAIVRRDGRVRLVAAGADDLHALLERTAPLLTCAAPELRTPSRYQAIVRRDAITWRRQVERTLAAIAAGRLAKLVLARTADVRADRPFDALRIVRRLRASYPGCAVFAVRRGGSTFVGASPERLVAVDGDRLDTAALAGTTGRGGGPSADRALADALLASPKERAEHAHVVDDLRARLLPLCRDVHVADAPSVLVTETVQHLLTPVTARLHPGMGLLDAVAALHPTPAICGAPRAAALAALPRYEHLVRGWYGGGVGWVGADGGEVSVALRAGLLRGRLATLYAGAGIVAGSRWEAELEETRLKLRPLLGALMEL
ncbi:MAG TPA: isochorismate synthase [Candidatus Binatia bacterium]|jgi:salicylate biosynthesis isochorismate synthase/menaquinone-specific isochorismate synthase|nr:isochorismate synthase [Candidatus Binatia bacterium]